MSKSIPVRNNLERRFPAKVERMTSLTTAKTSAALMLFRFIGGCALLGLGYGAVVSAYAAFHFAVEAQAGIFAVRRVKKSDIENIGLATGARVVNSLDVITKADLGSAGLVEEKKLSNNEMTFVTGCKNPKAVSIIIRGGSDLVIDELERGMHDALMVVSDVVKDKKIVAGGGAPETELSLQLRRYASSMGGRVQLAIEAFASALEIIPRSIAENAGLDPIDMIVAIRAAHEAGHRTFGLDVYAGKPVDMLKAGVVEPLRVKTQAISSAAEAAVMILRIDDVIASSKSGAPEGMPPGGMGGMRH